MLYTFLFISLTAIFSSLLGIFVNVLLRDHGLILAIAFYGTCYFLDYISTVRVKNFAKHEANPLYQILSKRIGTKLSFLVICIIGITVCILSEYLLQDTIFVYIFGITHLCVAATNYNTAKKVLEKNT